MFNLEWYRENLTKAAQQLHITQPSVSYAIKQMEETLGLKLFHRLSKGVELTEEGRALLTYVERSFSLLDAAQKHLHDFKQLTEGEVSIGASHSLIKHLLLPQLYLFHTKYPGIRIRLLHGRTPDLTQRLKEGLIDCAIVHMSHAHIRFAVGYPDTGDIKGFLRSRGSLSRFGESYIINERTGAAAFPSIISGEQFTVIRGAMVCGQGFHSEAGYRAGEYRFAYRVCEFRLRDCFHYPLLREGGASKR